MIDIPRNPLGQHPDQPSQPAIVGGTRVEEQMLTSEDVTHKFNETIRYTFQRFDNQHPIRPVQAAASGPEQQWLKRRLFRQYCAGVSLATLANRFQLPQDEARRLVREMRVQRISELPLSYVSSGEFEHPAAGERILGPMPQPEHPPLRARRPVNVSSYLASLYDVLRITTKQEFFLFRKYNYLKYRATQLRDGLDPAHGQDQLLGEIEQLYRQTVDTMSQIIRANSWLVASIAIKYTDQQEMFYELVSDGNMSLIKAVEKFDYKKGNRFRIYALGRIKYSFAHTLSVQPQHFDRFLGGPGQSLESVAEQRANPSEQESAQRQYESAVSTILYCLNHRERGVIEKRFGLNGFSRAHTLQEIGTDLGLCRERIRQIESRALAKLRKAAVAVKIEAPAN